MVMLSDPLKYAALAVMLLAVLFAYYMGRRTDPAKGRSPVWTHVPLFALLIASIGPSAVATLIYLGYKSGLLQAGPRGYQFSSFIYQLPLDFAVMNWGFVALYVTSRLTSSSGPARFATWFSAAAMSLPNALLFLLAPEMVSNVFDAGQGIGVVQAMLSIPLWFGPYPSFLDPGAGIGILVFAPLAPIPLLGLMGWTVGWFASRAEISRKREAVRS